LFLLFNVPLFIHWHQLWKTGLQKAQEYKQTSELQLQLRKRLLNDGVFRHQFLQASSFKPYELDVIQSDEVLQLLDESEILKLWEKRHADANIRPYTLIKNSNTPPATLREYYREVREEADRQKGGFDPRRLEDYTLLKHPNLPADVIAEIHDLNQPYLDEILMKNPQFNSVSPKPAKP
jgi:hypothetical protein